MFTICIVAALVPGPSTVYRNRTVGRPGSIRFFDIVDIAFKLLKGRV